MVGGSTVAAGYGPLVVGIGQPLRGDDAIGLLLATRLRAYLDTPGHEHLASRVTCRELYELDITLAEDLARAECFYVVDALPISASVPAWPVAEPFRIRPLTPTRVSATGQGFMSHIFDWGFILALARDLYGRAPPAELVGVGAYGFELGTEVSPRCRANGEVAFEYLVGRLATR